MKLREVIYAIAFNEKISKKDKLDAIAYLCSDGARGPWERQFCRTGENVDRWFSKENPDAWSFINLAFPWEETPQGEDFWKTITYHFPEPKK